MGPCDSAIDKYVLEVFEGGTHDCTIIDCVIINRSIDRSMVVSVQLKSLTRSASNLLLIPMYHFSSEKSGSTIGRVQVF
jgi:hypothetical protein